MFIFFFFFSVLLINILRIQPSLFAPRYLERFAKRLFCRLSDRCPLVKIPGGGGIPSFGLNGYVPVIQGLIQGLESSTGYATTLALLSQIGKLEPPFNDNNNSRLFRYLQ